MNWSNAGLKNIWVNAFVEDSISKEIIAGTNHGVFISTDEGTSWTKKNEGLTDTNITSIAIKGLKIFAGSNKNGIYFSTDNGMNWIHINNGSTFTSISCLAVLDTELFAGTNDGGGIYLSKDYGFNWQQVGLSNKLVLSLVVNGDSIYAGCMNSGIYISKDKGLNWSWIGLQGTSVRSLVINGSSIIAGTLDGIRLSTDDGITWIQTNNTTLNSEGIWSLSNNGSDIIAGTVGSGIYRSTDSGLNWSQIGLPVLGTGCLTKSGSNIIAGTSNGVYLSSNEGIDWRQGGLSGLGITSINSNGTKIFAGSSGGGIYYSSDNATTWTKINNGIPTDASIRSIISKDSLIFAGTLYYGLYYSKDNGITWSQVKISSMVPYNNALALTMNTAGGDTLQIFVGNSIGVYLFDYTSDSCILVDTSLTYQGIHSLTYSSNNIFAGTINGVFLSTNNGGSWTQIDTNKENQSFYTFNVKGKNILAEAGNNGVLLSTDNGINWIETGLNDIPTYSLIIDNGNLLAGSYGIWKRPLSEIITDITDKHNNIPQNIELEQNYPNPFNPSTTIQYQIPKSGLVTIKVYDVLGREVKNLLNQNQSEGSHEINFNASNLSSGIYFYQLKAGNFISTKKMLLLK